METENRLLDLARNLVLEEAECIKHLLPTIALGFVRNVMDLYHCSGRLIISGIGKSAIVAQKMVATLNSTGTPAAYLHAAEAVHGDLGMIQKEDYVLVISNSGDSPEIKQLVTALQSFGNKIYALTGNENSFLATHAAAVFTVAVAKEAGENNLAPTNSTTAQMVIGDVIALLLMKLRGFTMNDFARFHPGGKLGKQLTLRVDDIYPNNACPTVSAGTPLKDVIHVITKGRLGIVAVVDETQHVLGVITDGDIRRLLYKIDHLSGIRAENIMTLDPKVIYSGAMAVDALNIMKKADIMQLLIVNNDRKLLGFIHLHDLVKEGL